MRLFMVVVLALLLALAKFTDILGQDRPRTRRGRIALEGSPPFAYANPLIAADGVWIINLESSTEHGTRIAKYLPLNALGLLNDQAIDGTLRINDVTDLPVLGWGRRTYTRSIVALRVTNTSGAIAIAAGTINLIVERQPADADSLARRLVSER